MSRHIRDDYATIAYQWGLSDLVAGHQMVNFLDAYEDVEKAKT